MKKNIIILALLPILFCCSKGDDFYPGIGFSVTVSNLSDYIPKGEVFLFYIEGTKISNYTPKFSGQIPSIIDDSGNNIPISALHIINSGTCLFILDYNKIGTVYLPKGKYLVLVTEDSYSPLQLVPHKYSYIIIDIQSGPVALKKVWQNDLEGYEEW